MWVEEPITAQSAVYREWRSQSQPNPQFIESGGANHSPTRSWLTVEEPITAQPAVDWEWRRQSLPNPQLIDSKFYNTTTQQPIYGNYSDYIHYLLCKIVFIFISNSNWNSFDLLKTEIYIEHKIFYQLMHDQDWSVNLPSGSRQGRLLLDPFNINYTVIWTSFYNTK